jgi:hypothetical protein
VEILVFTIVAIAIYFFADWLLRMIERWRGEVLKNRQIVFFVIILVSALVSFQLIDRFLAG